ncbi:hypothetical protein [Mycobacterium phage Weirdo19]|uniref:Uncharacterized protein n=1 Tax=Mycobacterium phage Weirdo19 TaxID=2601610 RepID=A0A6M2YSW1_9CAUD|nr:virion structural protein [Mycobacterium phage Weirdo19]QEA10792.1 hypothetical protein [Mycobacterium phage Weirdo19]
MATYSITPAVAQGMIGGTSTYREALGSSPKIRLYSGTPPAAAKAALSGNTLLCELSAAATPIASAADAGNGVARATWAAIASATAAATGIATFFRTVTSGGTVIDQGDVGTAGAALNLSTVALTAGSTVSLATRTSDLRYEPA